MKYFILILLIICTMSSCEQEDTVAPESKGTYGTVYTDSNGNQFKWGENSEHLLGCSCFFKESGTNTWAVTGDQFCTDVGIGTMPCK